MQNSNTWSKPRRFLAVTSETTMAMIEGHRAIAPPAGVAVWDVDPYDPAILADPAQYYAELRRRGPLVFIPR